MTPFRLALISVCVSVFLHAQDAKVVRLSDDDAARAKSSYDVMKKAEADWKAVQTDIEHRYVSDAHMEEEFAATVYSGSLNSISLATVGHFECAAADSYVVIKEHDGVISYSPNKLDPECVRKRDAQYAQEKLDAAKAAREAEERQKHPKIHTVYTLKLGWTEGVVFSPDFQFIVPKMSPPISTGSGSGVVPSWPFNGSYTTLPAVRYVDGN